MVDLRQPMRRRIVVEVEVVELEQQVVEQPLDVVVVVADQQQFQ